MNWMTGEIGTDVGNYLCAFSRGDGKYVYESLHQIFWNDEYILVDRKGNSYDFPDYWMKIETPNE